MKSKTAFVGASQVWSGRICISNFMFCTSFDSLYGEEEGAQEESQIGGSSVRNQMNREQSGVESLLTNLQSQIYPR